MVISTSVRLFRQLSVCRSVCRSLFVVTKLKNVFGLPFLLKKYNNLFGNYQGALEGIFLVVQMHKIISTPVTLPQRSCFQLFFAHFCVSLLFLYSSVFLRTIQLLHINYLQMFLVFIRGFPH